MTNPKGTKQETGVVRYLRENGWPYARRIVKEGQRDKGDVTLGDGIPFTIESKNTPTRIDLAGTLKELEIEMANAGHELGAAIIKRKGTTNVGKYYAVMPVEILNALVRGYFDGASGDSPAVGRRRDQRRVIPRLDTL